MSYVLPALAYNHVNPFSGHLATTVYPPSFVTEVPLTDMALRAGPGRTHMYYNGTPEFKFGEGLSYFTWGLFLEPLSITEYSADNTSIISFLVRVTNLGPTGSTVGQFSSAPGKKTILAFWRPKFAMSHLASPRQKLFDYKNILVLSGESQDLVFELHVAMLASVDPSGRRVLHLGAYEIAFYNGELEVAVTVQLLGLPVFV